MSAPIIPGGPTVDKPDIGAGGAAGPRPREQFLNIRVADTEAVYIEWRSRRAESITPPDHLRNEIRSLRDRDGHLIEVGQTTAVESP
jgi:hypothetical protein